MMKIVAIFSSASLHVNRGEMFAEFLENLSRNVHSGDTTDISLNELEELNASIRKTELPKTREEFEIRANLFYLIFEVENYLNIKEKNSLPQEVAKTRYLWKETDNANL